MFHKILSFLFPDKCVLCRKILENNESDICHHCRANAPEFIHGKKSIPFVAEWTAVWYYKDNVRNSLLRYKFYNARNYAAVYGRHLAMKLLQNNTCFDILTWVPISCSRKLRRGYDQVELISKAVGKELGVSPIPTLKKIRNTPPQSNLADPSARRANILGAYRALDCDSIRGKRILILDDVITTGSTVSECAKTLLVSGASEVICAAVAAASKDKK